MAVSLQKGQKVSLSKENPGLSRVIVGLGWDEAKPAKRGLFGFGARTQAIDCDASALVCVDGKIQNTKDVVFYNNLTHPSGAVKHMGDNLTGAGEGDDAGDRDRSRPPPRAVRPRCYVCHHLSGTRAEPAVRHDPEQLYPTGRCAQQSGNLPLQPQRELRRCNRCRIR